MGAIMSPVASTLSFGDASDDAEASWVDVTNPDLTTLTGSSFNGGNWSNGGRGFGYNDAPYESFTTAAWTLDSRHPLVHEFEQGGGDWGTNFQWNLGQGWSSVPSWALVPATTLIKPDAPSDVVATALSNTVVNVKWTDNSDNELGFAIERSTSGLAGSWQEIGIVSYVDGTGNTVEYADKNLTPGTKYYYRVRSFYSDDSDAVAAPAVTTTTDVAGGGLTGRYYNEFDFVSPPVATIPVDPLVDKDFDANRNLRPTGFSITNEGVVWVGRILAPVTGKYTFGTASDDGTAVWLDDDYTTTATVDNSNFQGWGLDQPDLHAGTVTWDAGTFHTVKVLFCQGGGGARATLFWKVPGSPWSMMDPQFEFPPDYSVKPSVGPTNVKATTLAADGSSVLAGRI